MLATGWDQHNLAVCKPSSCIGRVHSTECTPKSGCRVPALRLGFFGHCCTPFAGSNGLHKKQAVTAGVKNASAAKHASSGQKRPKDTTKPLQGRPNKAIPNQQHGSICKANNNNLAGKASRTRKTHKLQKVQPGEMANKTVNAVQRNTSNKSAGPQGRAGPQGHHDEHPQQTGPHHHHEAPVEHHTGGSSHSHQPMFGSGSLFTGHTSYHEDNIRQRHHHAPHEPHHLSTHGLRTDLHNYGNMRSYVGTHEHHHVDTHQHQHQHGNMHHQLTEALGHHDEGSQHHVHLPGQPQDSAANHTHHVDKHVSMDVEAHRHHDHPHSPATMYSGNNHHHHHQHQLHPGPHQHQHAARASARNGVGIWKARHPYLQQGAAAGRLLFLDAYTSGVAGDMLVAGLVDLGVPWEVVDAALQGLQLPGFEVWVGSSERSGIVCSRFAIDVQPEQPLRDYSAIKKLLDSAALPDGAKAIAAEAFRRLAVAEASVHGMDVDAVHFHEVGGVDSIVDIVAAAVAIDYLRPTTVITSPLPMGRGIIHGAAHGPLPCPPPAVVDVLCGAGIDTFDAGCNNELVTPTGACVVAAIAQQCSRWPHMQPYRCGYGAGSKQFADRPNLVRIVLSQVL